jgi:hypothetical protein
MIAKEKAKPLVVAFSLLLYVKEISVLDGTKFWNWLKDKGYSLV